MRVLLFILLTFIFNKATAFSPENASYNQGFVSINKVDPSIIISLKYADTDNFLQTKLPGYSSSDAILTVEAAEALKSVQEYLVTRGYSLIVYDAYHPLKTYECIEAWSQQPDDPKIKALYYPNISKTQLISDGYIRNKLDHTRGSTVDVTIIPLNKKVKNPCSQKKLHYKDTGAIIYMDDGTVDMGSSYDVFGPVAAPECDSIEQNARDNRALLKEAMESHGFIANSKVWWQYRLAREPYLDSNFEFDA